jgi:hypothetical protein
VSGAGQPDTAPASLAWLGAEAVALDDCGTHQWVSENMPLEPQPHDRRGTVGHAYSALNLRLLLAAFGVVTSVVFAVLLFRAGVALGWLFIVIAVAAAVDIVVIQLRRRARRRVDGNGHSLFE